jgi:hypothetical protein
MSRGVALALGALVAVGAAAGALVLYRKAQAGEWKGPEELAEAVDDFLTSPFEEPLRVPRTIWLVRGGMVLRGGGDDSAARLSSVVAQSKNNVTQVTVPRFRGTDKLWKQFVACVQAQYAPFDVVVTDVEPSEPGYVLVAVGGKPSLLGYSSRTTGLAPYAASVIMEDPVVFVFSDALGNRVQPMCETAAMEIAHAYGLDHEYLCKDPMSYMSGCGKKTFQDKDARCGEHKARDCGDGQPTQNSVRMLLEALGPTKVVKPAPPVKPARPAPAPRPVAQSG